MSNFGRNDDYGRIQSRPYRQGGLDRQKRLYLTIGVGAALVLIFGGGIGFALGRATAPEPEPAPAQAPVAETTMPAGAVETLPAETVEPELTAEEPSEEATATDEEAPPRPKQLAPKDGAVINASRVYLKWSKVEDDSGEPVTYAFEIQDRLPSGKYGKTQIISGLKSTSYSARVLYVKRRWRVWATDEAGNSSDKTGWDYYIHKPKPKPQPSDETT